jgi:hypothetical protein
MKWVVATLIINLALPVMAQKVGASFGYYNIQAESSNANGTINLDLTRLGSYQLSAHFPMLDDLDLGVGYSIFYSRTFGGDMGFGPDIFVNYFPLSRNGRRVWNESGIRLFITDTLRPYFGLAFHQRQFQSVQTSYSGFGIQAGLEWAQSVQWGYHFKFSAQNLIGPSSLSFRFIDLSFGLQYYLD